MKPAFLGLLFAVANTSALAQWPPPLPDTCTDYPILTAPTLENTPAITTEPEDIPTTVDPPSTTSTCTGSASITATGPCPDVTAKPASEPTSTYTTLTVSHAPVSPGGSTTLTKTPGALKTTARPFTSNGGTANAAAFISTPRGNATATIQPFLGDATIMHLNFPFAVSVMGIFVVSFCLL